MKWIHLTIPVADEKELASLEAGDAVLLTGHLYTARDRAHTRLVDMIENSERLPFDMQGQFLYYVGPSPARPGQVIGSAGPTTSYRMDPFTDAMLKEGIKGMIGKGKRSPELREVLPYYNAVYFSSFGGAGAYLSKRIRKCDCIAFEDLGPEAIYRLEVADFPVIVINDTQGNDLYEITIQRKQ